MIFKILNNQISVGTMFFFPINAPTFFKVKMSAPARGTRNCPSWAKPVCYRALNDESDKSMPSAVKNVPVATFLVDIWEKKDQHRVFAPFLFALILYHQLTKF